MSHLICDPYIFQQISYFSLLDIVFGLIKNFSTDARSCVTCDKVLAELEKIDDDTDHFGVDFVKINDKRLAKQYGIKNFPALTYFREKEPIIYEGKPQLSLIFFAKLPIAINKYLLENSK